MWKASSGGSSYLVRAKRLSVSGTPVDATPLEIATGLTAGWEAEPTVAGLESGWVVVWTSPTIDGDLGGIAYARVDADGTVGTPSTANVSTFLGQFSPSVARLGDGFVIAWTDQSTLMPGIHGTRVEARRFGGDGVALGDEFEVSTSWENQQDPAIAADDGGFLVAWTASNYSSIYPAVVARRFGGTGLPIDTSPFRVSDVDMTGIPVIAFGAATARLESGDWAVAWTSRGDDFDGDVRAATVAASGPSPVGASVLVAGEIGVAERMPSVAPLSGGAFAVMSHRATVGTFYNDILLASVGGPLAPEAAGVAALLSGPGIENTGSLQTFFGRLWVVWSDDLAVAGVPRALVAEVLAVE